MRTIRLIPSRPRLLALVGGVLLVGLLIGWIATQNARYDSRLDTAYEPVIAAFQRTPTGLDEKNSIVAQHLPGVVTSVKIGEVIYEITFLPDQRRQLEALRTVKPPALWRSYHQSLIDLQRARVAAFEAQYEQLQYADGYLGARASVERIAQLATDARYVELGQLADLQVDEANRLGRKFNRSAPVLAAWLPKSPDVKDEARMRSGHFATDTVPKASRCAQSELDGNATTQDCAQLLRYVPEQPACAVSLGSVVSPCPERAVPCPPSTDPNAPTTGPDGLPMPRSYRSASAPASLCG